MPNRLDHLHITTKQVAKDLQMKRYFTGRPCKSGHISIRYKDGKCAACLAIASAEWQSKNPEKVKKAKRKYLEENRDKHYRSVERWQAENRHRLRSYVSEWVKRNPERKRILNQRRRSLLKGSGGSFTSLDLFLILLSQDGKCPACGVEILDAYQIDHIIPVSKGGSGLPSNIQCLCAPCNLSKGSKNYEQWLAARKEKIS